MKHETGLKAIRIALVFGCLALWPSTSGSGVPESLAGERASERWVVDQLWQWQRQRIVLVSETDSAVDLTEFQRAVRFFEKTTGIPYENGSFLGQIPSPVLKVALGRWDAWYKSNQARLQINWDECLLLKKEHGVPKERR